jgi:predicted alpha/beta hydrolase family esterase
MKNAIILHGKPGKKEYYDPKVPSASNNHWFPWLQKQLLVHGIVAYTPEVPNSWKPHYPTWKEEFERFEITPETVLVGHSCGGGFLVRWLSENKSIKAGKVVLVAPWFDPDREDTTDFFEFTMDPNLTDRTESITIFNSDGDEESVQKTVKTIRESIKDINYREFHNYGHFCRKDLKTEEFPEVLEEVLK